MSDCMKRRLLFASSEAYYPEMEVHRRTVGWVSRPIVVSREVEYWHRPIDQALVGEVREGIVVAFRGSLPPFYGGDHDGWSVLLDWMNDGLALCVADRDYAGAGVHMGFAESVRRLWDDHNGQPGIRAAIQALLDRGARRHLFLTGHSKGGALANLAAYRAARYAGWRDMPVSVATFAAARAGDRAFATAYSRERIACLRYELDSDPVPHLPPGPQTPAVVRQLARTLWPRLRTGDYHPVGERVGGDFPRASWPRVLAGHLVDLARMRDVKLSAFTPTAVAAHAICPGSGYDRLVCVGEPDCGHGKRVPGGAKPPLRHERAGTRGEGARTDPRRARRDQRQRDGVFGTTRDDVRQPVG